jgi:hypothetical protein
MNPRILSKSIMIALTLSLVSIEAQAVSRYNSTSMSCSAIQSRVWAEGAVLLRWRSTKTPGLPLGDRFVRNSSYCSPHLWAKTFHVPTADRKKCPLLRCERLNSLEEKYGVFRFHRR